MSRNNIISCAKDLQERVASAMWNNLRERGGFANARQDIRDLYLKDAEAAISVMIAYAAAIDPAAAALLSNEHPALSSRQQQPAHGRTGQEG